METDPEFREKRQRLSTEYYRERAPRDPEWMAERAAKLRERRQADPEFRAKGS